MAIPISLGSGAASIASTTIGNDEHQNVIITSSNASVITVKANQSVSGTVGASIIGTVPVTGSFAVQSASVVQQGTWYASVLIASVVGAIPVSGSFSPSGNQSVSGTVGASVIGNVNTTITSIAAANGGVAKNAAVTQWVNGTADFRSNTGASVAVIAGQGGSTKTYVTGLQVANMGSASVLVTLAGSSAGGSILGYTIAPAGGGSNIHYENALITGGDQPFTASISGVASVLVSAQGFTSDV